MPTESVKVLAVSNEQLLLAPDRRSCSACSGKGNCTQYSFLTGDNQSFTLPLDESTATSALMQVGERLELSLPATTLLKLTLAFYLMPLVLMLGALLLANGLGAGEGVVVLSAAAGLAAGFGVLSWHMRAEGKTVFRQMRRCKYESELVTGVER